MKICLQKSTSIHPRGAIDTSFYLKLRDSIFTDPPRPKVEGNFAENSCVVIKIRNDTGGEEDVGRALINYCSDDLVLIKGRKTQEFEKVLGYMPSIIEVALRENIICVNQQTPAENLPTSS